MRTPTLAISAAVLGLAAPTLAAAQVANPLPQAMGMGGNYTALARGFGAPAWNPAGLGMPDNPGASFTFLPLAFSAGLSPITPADLAEFDGQNIPASAREQWLATITDAGGETGAFGVDVTYLGLSIGRVAITASSGIRSRVNLAPDVAEVLFFGNAGLTGDPGDYTLAGSNFDVAGTSTLAASLGIPLSISLGPLPDQHFALGVTLKYIVGNFLMLGQEAGSSLTSNPIAVDVQFPMVHTPLPDDSASELSVQETLNNGVGYGVDIGAAWKGGIFSAGVAVKNVVNTFAWDVEKLQFREGTVTWSADSVHTDFERSELDPPADLIDRIQTLYAYSPVLAAGAAARILPFLTVTGEMRHSLEEGLEVGSRNHVGLGAELTLIPFIPLRAGIAAISGGYQLSGGLGLKLGPVQLSVAGSARQTELGDDAQAAIGLTFGVR